MGVDGYEEYLEYKAEYFFEILKKKNKKLKTGRAQATEEELWGQAMEVAQREHRGM